MNPTKITPNLQTLSSTTNLLTLQIENLASKDIEQFIEGSLEQIKENSEFELGAYSSEERLVTDLKRKVFGKKDISGLRNLTEEESVKIAESVKNNLTKCYEYAPIEGVINAYIFPMCNEEASKDLDGVNAFALGKHTMYLFIDSGNENWEQSLAYTIAHEYAHLVSASYFEWNTLIDGIVFEGLAEHLREHLYGGEPAKYSLALTKEEAIREFLKLRTDPTFEVPINDDNYEWSLTYFFGGEGIPKWYAYSVGYWLIDNIIREKGVSVAELLKASPKDILKLVY